MSELHDEVRALLALRDKATPGPWRPGIPMNPSDFHFAERAHDMADKLAELLAENERLTARLHELASAEPVLWYCEHSCVTDTYQHGTYTSALIRRPEMPS